MLNKTIHELKAQNRSAELDHFDYKNEKLRESFQSVLKGIEFNGMIVSNNPRVYLLVFICFVHHKGRIHFDSTADHSHERREATERIEINLYDYLTLPDCCNAFFS